MICPLTIVSGGQTGADRAALDLAIAHGIEHEGWCPVERRAEDGPLDAKYHLTEIEREGYQARIVRNVRDSDATLILNLGELEGAAWKRCESPSGGASRFVWCSLMCRRRHWTLTHYANGCGSTP